MLLPKLYPRHPGIIGLISEVSSVFTELSMELVVFLIPIPWPEIIPISLLWPIRITNPISSTIPMRSMTMQFVTSRSTRSKIPFFYMLLIRLLIGRCTLCLRILKNTRGDMTMVGKSSGRNAISDSYRWGWLNPIGNFLIAMRLHGRMPKTKSGK